MSHDRRIHNIKKEGNFTPEAGKTSKENIKYLCTTFRKHINEMECEEVLELTKWFDDYIWPRWTKILEAKLQKKKKSQQGNTVIRKKLT